VTGAAASGVSGRAGDACGARAREAAARARAYELLALAFAPPSGELAAALSRRDPALALPAVDPAALVLEHTRLFVGPGRAAAPPYGSLYHEGRGLMGESTLDVLRRYREAGLTFTPERGELPDHVVSELSFLSVLAEEEARAWEAGDEAGARGWLVRRGAFLWDHLGAWAPELSQRMLGATDEPFYRTLAVSLRELVAVDLEYVTSLVAPPEEAAGGAERSEQHEADTQ
jgi:TorA maturation chaperone TorD